MSERDEARMQHEDRRIAEIYERTAREEPPIHLDAAIAREARGASPNASAKRPWWFAWRLPLAFATIGVVSVTLVALMVEEGADRLPEPARTAPTVPRPAQPAAPREAPLQDSAAAKPSAATPSPRTQAPGRKAVERQSARPELPAAPPDALPVEPAPARAPPASPAEPATAAPEVFSSEAAAAAKATPEAAETRKRETAPSQDRGAAAPVPAPPVAAREAPMVQPSPAISARPEARARLSAPAEPKAQAFVAELEGKPAAAWIERIAGLRKEGRDTEADALIAEFRKRFPNETLPAALR